MTAQEIKASMTYRGKMQKMLDSGVVVEAGQDWIRMELYNHQRDIQKQIAAELREERKVELKNARLGGRTPIVRSRLKQLIVSILSHMGEMVKGVDKRA